MTGAYPEGLDGWHWYGLALRHRGETRGILQSLPMAGPMRDAVERVAECFEKSVSPHLNDIRLCLEAAKAFIKKRR